MNALEPSSCEGALRRPKAFQAARRELVHDAGDQRPLGTDNGEGYFFGERQRYQRGNVFRRNIRIPYLRLGGRAGVSRRHNDLGDARRSRALPRQRVLASPGSDDQNFHLVAEVAHAGEHHGEPMLIRGRDDFGDRSSSHRGG